MLVTNTKIAQVSAILELACHPLPIHLFFAGFTEDKRAGEYGLGVAAM